MRTIVFIFVCFSFITQTIVQAQLVDIDGNTYKTVRIGNQEWFAENLNVSHFRNGDPIPEARTGEEWEKAGLERLPAWSYYENDTENGKIYGKLYNWYAVNDPRGLAPEGWTIPSKSDWDQLESFLKGGWIAVSSLKSKNGWPRRENGNNRSGFTALPGGHREPQGAFGSVGHIGRWWSSTETDSPRALLFGLSFLDYSSRDSFSKAFGLSVRCVKE